MSSFSVQQLRECLRPLGLDPGDNLELLGHGFLLATAAQGTTGSWSVKQLIEAMECVFPTCQEASELAEEFGRCVARVRFLARGAKFGGAFSKDLC